MVPLYYRPSDSDGVPIRTFAPVNLSQIVTYEKLDANKIQFYYGSRSQVWTFDTPVVRDEVLEELDALTELITSYHLDHMFPEVPEGDLHNLDETH